MFKIVINWFKNLGAFGIGMLLGTCYGSVVATLVSYALLQSLALL